MAVEEEVEVQVFQCCLLLPVKKYLSYTSFNQDAMNRNIPLCFGA